ncbi:MAG TPA: superoxide dismutase family protein [Myxococcaceae bacterium]|nr:superoxide dismutase family protein [Myxococcaceae bacterium]
MKLGSVTVFAVAALTLSGCATSPGNPPPPQGGGASATATIEGRSNTNTGGTARFTQSGKEISLLLQVTNLTPGTHAVHIHEKGDCSAPDASSAGPHWNPTGQSHGRWGHNGFHLGDLGNLDATADGTATLKLSTDQWTLGDGGPTDIVGKAVVVHAGVDDFTSQPAGNAGGRVGCGVITAAGR